MKSKKRLSLPIQILIGLIAGVIVGILLQNTPNAADTYIKPIGTVFLNLIKLVIVPLVFSSLIVGVADLKDAKEIGKIGLKTFVYFFVTTAFAIIIGLALANIFDVASGFVLPSDELAFEAKEAPKFIDTLVGIIPSNPLKALVDGQMLQIIVFALIIGAGILHTGKKGEFLFKVFDGLQEAMIIITNGVMKVAPYGVFGLITPVVASNGPQVLLPLLKVIALVYVGCFVQAMIVYAGSISLISKLPVHTFFKKVFAPWALAFTTSSSAGTLPAALECAQNDLGVSKPIASFVLPLGSTINMDGTAIYQGVCALFIAQVYGLDLSLSQQLTIVLTTLLASIGTAGVPGAGMIMLAMVLQGVGIPVEGIALVAGVDRIFDMVRTSINVLGDITCSVVVAKSVGQLDEEVFRTTKANISK
ncbi:MAG: dicarboxylate/amino acid:cation symporter [Ezakiella sp.]|nr:dicarboxylate/amino acid:cation symporter [Ezakiella sp.]MDD7471280.1 dicarboxylate/amino acid:cation symporter [Bacillota bacterium]MDY3923625.1 dicarboxylate/amino acid:cation symporter [Ezakiella sp.]